MSSENLSPRGLDRGRLVLVVLLLAALFLAYRIVRPFLDPILLAVILTPIVFPVFARLRRLLGGRGTPAALLACLLVVVVIAGPLALVATAIVAQGVGSVQHVQAWLQAGRLDQALNSAQLDQVKSLMKHVLPLVDPDRIDVRQLLLTASQKVGGFLLAKGGTLLSRTGGLLGNLLLMVFVLFYTLRDGEQLLAGILRLSPLRASQEAKLVERIRAVSRSAILGSFATAAAQGVAGGIGLAIVGIPALFWGTMMAFASLIPVVGTTLVWGPASLYLLLDGHPGKALFLFVYSAVVVGSIDNFLRPVLMRGESGMSTVWLFFSILGGLQLFGLLGVIYGPVVFALCSVLLFLYQEEFAGFLGEQQAR